MSNQETLVIHNRNSGQQHQHAAVEGDAMNGEDRLLVKAKAGDLSALEALIVQYEKKVFNYCYRMTGSREDAEDLTQEVFLKVYRSLSTFQGNSQFSTWLYRIAHNICIDKYRRQKAVVVPLTFTENGEERDRPLPDNAPTPEEQVLSLEQQAQIQKCMEGLRPEYRAVIVLRDIQHHSYEEIAEIMKLPQGTVKSYISRGRAALRAALMLEMQEVST